MSRVHEVFHVSMLRRYTPDPAHEMDWGKIEVDTDRTFEEGPGCILDSRDVTPRPERVYSTCNCRGVYEHQVSHCGILDINL